MTDLLARPAVWPVVSFNPSEQPPGELATRRRAESLVRRRALVDRVRAYAWSQLGEPLSMRSLTQFAGVSPRTLEYAFQDVVGMPPTVWYRTVRFAAARRTLARSAPRETSVTKVANRFGFQHLGRFSGDYRRRFGESPSETLRRQPEVALGDAYWTGAVR